MKKILVLSLMLLSPGMGLMGQTTVNEMLEQANKQVTQVDTAQLAAMLKKDPQTYLIDVRQSGEIDDLGGTIEAPNSFNIPRGWLEFRIGERVLDKSAPIVVFCGINQRSPLAAATLKQLGYTNVYNYKDGFFEWKKAGQPVYETDRYAGSFLFRKPEQVSKNVYSAIGATAPQLYANTGHNNNLSFIVTSEGVVVVNAGGAWLLAQALHDEIRKVTDQPVKYVILENGQGHAMLGSSYWQALGAKVIAHKDAAAEIKAHGERVYSRAQAVLGDRFYNTKLSQPDILFADKYELKLGGEVIQALHLGPAHSPGDISVWLPRQKLTIAGDIAFHQRLPPIFEETDTAAWIKTWDAFAALGAEIVIPGHGDPTNMKEVTKFTRDYLVHLRKKIAEVIDEGGSLADAYEVDQSPYAHLHTYHELRRLNAAVVFQRMEFE